MKHTFALLALAATTQAIAVQSQTQEETRCQQLPTRVNPLDSLRLKVPDCGDVTLAGWTHYSIAGYGSGAKVSLAIDLEMTLHGSELSVWEVEADPVLFFQYSEEDMVIGNDFWFISSSKYTHADTYSHAGVEQPPIEDYDDWEYGPSARENGWNRPRNYDQDFAK